MRSSLCHVSVVGHTPHIHIGVGGYRIVYEVDSTASLVLTRAMAPRGEAYQ